MLVKVQMVFLLLMHLKMKVCEFICHVNWRRRFLGMNMVGI